jgi:molecular chaperone IbpA
MTNLIQRFDASPFYRNSVGIDRLFDILNERVDTTTSSNYPPYNIVKTSDNTYEIQVAVAGFGESDLDITVQDGQLLIVGDKEVDTGANYLHQGISNRKFTRKFILADFVEVRHASVENGILTVQLEREIPEEQKPRSIAIEFK